MRIQFAAAKPRYQVVCGTPLEPQFAVAAVLGVDRVALQEDVSASIPAEPLLSSDRTLNSGGFFFFQLNSCGGEVGASGAL